MWQCYTYLLALSAAQQPDFYGGAQWHKGDVPAQLGPAGQGVYYDTAPRPTCEGLWIRPLNRTNQSPKHRCSCNSTTVSCINLQMTPPPPGEDSEESQYFMEIDDEKFSQLEHVTIHGNNLERLPKVLFGPGSAFKNLKQLNLSSNYFINVEPGAFQQALPQLRVLDLSNNEITLNKKNYDIFSYLPNLKELYLRNTFNHYKHNETVRHLDHVFRRAAFKGLEKLTLDGNNLSQMPENVGCHFRELTHLSFHRNRIKRWVLVSNGDCTTKLQFLDVSRQFEIIVGDEKFVTFVEGLPRRTILSLNDNQFLFTNASLPFFEWLNETERAVNLHNTVAVYPGIRTPLTLDREWTRDELLKMMSNPPNPSPTLSLHGLAALTVCYPLLLLNAR